MPLPDYGRCVNCGADEGMGLSGIPGRPGRLAVWCCFCGHLGPSVPNDPPSREADIAAIERWNQEGAALRPVCDLGDRHGKPVAKRWSMDWKQYFHLCAKCLKKWDEQDGCDGTI
jgi:hypothetical protein